MYVSFDKKQDTDTDIVTTTWKSSMPPLVHPMC